MDKAESRVTPRLFTLDAKGIRQPAKTMESLEIPDRRCISGKGTLAVMLEPVSWDKESGCITCRAQNARDSVRPEKVREI